MDTYNDEGIECPKCGYVCRESYEFDSDDGECECERCEAVLLYCRNVSVSYSAKLKEPKP